MSYGLPLVTIVALCYNHYDYLTETLDSILNQEYENLEVIIVDDFSKDDSVELIENWLSKETLSWSFIRHEVNWGICKSLNETLDIANGKYFKIIACDDLMMPNFISTMVERFELLQEEYAMIYSDVQTINENSEAFGLTPFVERGWDTEEKVPSGELFDQLAGSCFIPAPSTLLRTRVLQDIRFDESLIIEDWDMWLQIAKRYKIKGISEAMIHYRIHQASMFQKKSPIFRDHELRTVKKHMNYSSIADIAIKDFIYRNSMLSFLNNGDRLGYWLWQRFLIKPNFSNLFHAVLANIGISYDTKRKFEQKWIGIQ